MKIEILMSKLFGFSPGTYFNWKKEEEKRPIIKFLNNYFNKKELIEFISTGKIDKFDNLKTTTDFLNSYKNRYFNFLHVKMANINSLSKYQLQFYFSYLFFICAHHAHFSIHSHPFYASLARFALENKDEASKDDKDSLHIIYDIVDFLENEKMWDYFVFLLKNDFKHFIEGMDLDDYFEEDGITLKTDSIENDDDDEDISDEKCEEYLKLKQPLNVDGLDHYCLYHEYKRKKLNLR